MSKRKGSAFCCQFSFKPGLVKHVLVVSMELITSLADALLARHAIFPERLRDEPKEARLDCKKSLSSPTFSSVRLICILFNVTLHV